MRGGRYYRGGGVSTVCQGMGGWAPLGGIISERFLSCGVLNDASGTNIPLLSVFSFLRLPILDSVEDC